MQVGMSLLGFLPAAKPTGLVELNVLLSLFHHLFQKGQKSPNKHGSICSVGHKFQIRRDDLCSVQREAAAGQVGIAATAGHIVVSGGDAAMVTTLLA